MKKCVRVYVGVHLLGFWGICFVFSEAKKRMQCNGVKPALNIHQHTHIHKVMKNDDSDAHRYRAGHGKYVCIVYL
jgi:hypothetical protein